MAEAVIALKNIYSRNRNTFLLIIKVLVTTGLLTYLIKAVNIRDITSGIMQADIMLLLTAFGLSFLNILLQYLKWKLVCNTLLHENNNSRIVNSLFYGFSSGSFTPARLGEYFGRALAFSDKPLFLVSSAVLIDKLFSLFIVISIGFVSFMVYLDFSFTFSVGITLLIVVLIYAGFHVIKKILTLNNYRWIRKANTRLTLLKSVDTSFSIKLTLLSLLFYSCFILQFALLIGAFSKHYNYLYYIWAGNLVMFTKTVLPAVSFGELGIREGASVFFIKHFGESAAAGFNASIFLFLINILIPAVTGLIFLYKKT